MERRSQQIIANRTLYIEEMHVSRKSRFNNLCTILYGVGERDAKELA